MSYIIKYPRILIFVQEVENKSKSASSVKFFDIRIVKDMK